jgi:hypothetical protein
MATSNPRKKLKYGYLWATLSLFIISLLGHWTCTWFAYASDARAHAQPLRVSDYLIQLGRGTFENWQSEFMSLVWQVGGLTWLWSIGSPQSKEGGDRLEEKVDFLLQHIEGGPAALKRLDAKYPRR